MGLIIIPGQDEPEPEPGHMTVRIEPEEIARWVAEAIAQNKGAVRTTRSQEILDRAVEDLHAEGEPYLAAGMLLLMSARIAGWEGPALEALMQTAGDVAELGLLDRHCRVCGCTQMHACPEGCSWVEIDLCSACDDKLKRQSRDAYKGSIYPGPGRDS